METQFGFHFADHVRDSSSEIDSDDDRVLEDFEEESDDEQLLETPADPLVDGEPFRELDKDLFDKMDAAHIRDKQYDRTKLDPVVGSKLASLDQNIINSPVHLYSKIYAFPAFNP